MTKQKPMNKEQPVHGEWKIEYDNDTGFDGGFWEWWNVTNGNISFKAYSESDANFLLSKLTLQPPASIQEAAKDVEDEAIDRYPIYPIYGDVLNSLNWQQYIDHIRKAFIAGATYQSSKQGGVEAGRWVDASLRLPDSKLINTYFVKQRLKDSDENWFPGAITYSGEWEISEDYEVIEWLDESPTSNQGEDKSK